MPPRFGGNLTADPYTTLPDSTPPQPDWRITCCYTDRRHRRQGIGRAALEGALDLIAQTGGGLVEALPEVTAGRTAQGRFLFEVTVELYEEYGFQRVRQIGKHRWIVSRVLDPTDRGVQPELSGHHEH